MIQASWERNWNDLTEFFNYPKDIRRAIYTTTALQRILSKKTAKEAGITREGLYKALSPVGNPAFSTVWNILHSLGYTLTPIPTVK